jgi:micrococcal nuclease
VPTNDDSPLANLGHVTENRAGGPEGARVQSPLFTAGMAQRPENTLMRLTLALLLFLVTLLPLGGSIPLATAQGDGCDDYDTQAEAQAALDAPDADDDLGMALDADLDGIACPDLEPGKERGVPRTDELPDGLVKAEVVAIVDGDTLKVRFTEGDDEGEIATVRLIGIDTPETKDPNDPVECYGAEATKRLETMLPAGRTVYLEQDISDTDRYDRLLRYVWFEGKRDGKAYLANEILVREGFAVVSTFPPDVAHVEAFTHAQDVATFREAGLWEECGGADTPLSAVATQAPPTRVTASTVPPAPTQAPLIMDCAAFGSFAEADAYYAANPAAQPFLDPNVDGRACEVFFGVDQAAAPPPAAPPGGGGGGCDPSYPSVCIPPYPPDLDCPDVGVTNFTVLQPDPHGFDRDQDGIGCES